MLAATGITLRHLLPVRTAAALSFALVLTLAGVLPGFAAPLALALILSLTCMLASRFRRLATRKVCAPGTVRSQGRIRAKDYTRDSGNENCGLHVIQPHFPVIPDVSYGTTST